MHHDDKGYTALKHYAVLKGLANHLLPTHISSDLLGAAHSYIRCLFTPCKCYLSVDELLVVVEQLSGPVERVGSSSNRGL